MIKACIFDLDGTLVDSVDDLACSLNYALKKNDLPTHSVKDIRTYLGNGMSVLVNHVVKDNQKKYQDVFSDFLNHYQENCCIFTKPFDGIEDLLNHLKDSNIKLAVVTNKKEDLAKKVVNQLFPKIPFIIVYGDNNIDPLKPNPILTQKAINMMDVKKDQCLFIGDSDVDILTAINAGLKSVGVTWGFRSKNELIQTGADFIIDQPMELEKIL